MNLMQNISKLINHKIKDGNMNKGLLVYSPEEYEMDEHSRFLDIGSGFGKPVFHAAMQVGCESKGIEVVPARVEFCIDFYYEFLNEKNFFEEVEKRLMSNNNTNFMNDNLSEKENSLIGNENGETCVNFENSTLDIVPSLSITAKTNKNINNAKSISAVNLTNTTNITNTIECDLDVEMKFINVINLNDINGSYYDEIIRDNNSNLYLELRINQDLIYEDCFLEMLFMKNQIQKSIICEDSELKFGNHFVTDDIELKITAIDDHLYSSVVKIVTNTLYTDLIENELISSFVTIPREKIRHFYEIAGKIENYMILNMIYFVNAIFNGRKSLVEINNVRIPNLKLLPIKKKQNDHKDTKKQKYKDLYEELLQELETKEKMYNLNTDISFLEKENEIDLQVLKETLVTLKYNYDDRWYKKTSFVAKDATIDKAFANDSKQHFTHIYAYNKLMSKVCRKKIAGILNKTKFKVLAWYSNPKQTKKAGLTNFTFICKFPMQSTSTEKFHVYIYIKSK